MKNWFAGIPKVKALATVNKDSAELTTNNGQQTTENGQQTTMDIEHCGSPRAEQRANNKQRPIEKQTADHTKRTIAK